MPVHTNMVLTPVVSQLVQDSNNYFASLCSQEIARYTELAASGRKEKVAVIGCYDSINDPNPFRCKPGEMGWHRNAGNCVTHFYKAQKLVDDIAATIDIAVSKDSLEALGIMGHQDCLFCKGFLTHKFSAEQDNLRRWVEYHGPVIRELMLNNFGPPPDPEDVERWNCYLWEAVQQHTMMQYYNLLSYPSVLRRVESGTLTVFATCLQLTPVPQLLWLDPMVGKFKPAAVAA